jgi:lipooligosaccharide transport system ATP-binding protein
MHVKNWCGTEAQPSTCINSPAHHEAVALVAYDLWKSYGSRTVVEGVNFTLNPGEILGLLGPNGAGKTTIVGMLYGTVRPSRGFVQLGHNQIQVQGRDARAQMGVVTQEDNLDPDFSVWENLMYFASLPHHRHCSTPANRRIADSGRITRLR